MDSRLISARVFPKKPLMLKDFLLDDLGSCSSNGFKSFPRRQCCSSVRFLHEIDLKNKQTKKKGASLNKPAFSAFRRVFAAVKRLPFPASLKSPLEKKKLKYSFLPRSFTALKRGDLWRRKSAVGKEIERWKSFDQLLREDPNEPSKSHRWPPAVGRLAAAAAAAAAAECSSGNGVMNGIVTADVNDVVEDKNGGEVGATSDDGLMESTTTSDSSVSTNSPTNPKQQQKPWLNEEKEQFSPMSVLDYCPFDDDDEVNSSPNFQQRLARMEGTKKKLMKKIHMFESLAKLEPINLATRFASKADDSDNESWAISEISTSDTDEQREDDDKVEINYDEGIEGKALELLHQIKDDLTPSYNNNLKPNPDSLLLDFFRERLLSNQGEGLLEDAQDWMQGQWPGEAALEWEVEKNRQGYVREMERGGEWKTLDQEIKEVACMLERETLDALLDQVLVDILVL